MNIFKNFGLLTNRRSILNVIVDSNAQLRFLFPFLVLFLACVGETLALSFIVSTGLNQISVDIISTNPEAVGDIQSIIHNVQIIASLGMFLIALLTVMFWLMYSHRIFGANYAIEKQIKNLQVGNFSETLTLRKNDEFISTANALNELAEKLRQQ
jgi:methyl-accepting chemotaxis protein